MDCFLFLFLFAWRRVQVLDFILYFVRFRFLDIRFSKVYSITCSFIIIIRIHLENKQMPKSGFFLSRSYIGWDSGFSSKIGKIPTQPKRLDSLHMYQFFLFLQKNVFKNQNKFACDLSRFLPSGAQLLCSSARILKVQLRSKLGADSLCSELSESCVILTL